MQKRMAIVICCFLVILVAGVLLGNQLSKVEDNDPDTIGNTSGNLFNNGYFCEDDSKIYFSNPIDNGYLYSMNHDMSDATCLVKAPVKFINSAGDYLYYYQEANKENAAFGSFVRNNGIYRLQKKKNSSADCLDRTTSSTLALAGSNVFYEHYSAKEGLSLYMCSIQGGDRRLVSNEEINPAGVYEGQIYFADQAENFCLSRFSPKTLQKEIISKDVKIYRPTFDSGMLYFMNIAENYVLYSLNLSSGELTQLTRERIDAFNVYNGVIFYQINDAKNPALMRMSINDLNPSVVANGNFTDINMTKNFTFFRDITTKDTFYYTMTASPSSVAQFAPK